MLTESFINSCFSLVLKDDNKINTVIYRDISEILKFYRTKENIDIPIPVKTKFDCLEKMCELLKDKKSINTTIDSVLASEKFKSLRNFIDDKKEEYFPESLKDDYLNQLLLRKKMVSLFSGYDALEDVMSEFKESSYDSMDDLIGNYENVIKKLNADMTNFNRLKLMETSASLDTSSDDFSSVLDNIIKKYAKQNVTPTGFDILDSVVFNGGFEKSRLYIFGGGSGSGKSTLMNNFIINAAGYNWKKIKGSEQYAKEKKVYIYITLENTIEEALLRTYQPMFKKTLEKTIEDIVNGVDIKKKINDVWDKNNSIVIMKYFKPHSISSLDIAGVVDEVIDKYGIDSIKGLYVDYLDKLKAEDHLKNELYRIELGNITDSLKTLAVEYNIPVITLTQLTRDVYRADRQALNMSMISESVKKVENADFIMLIILDPLDPNIVHGSVGKNRSGKTNINIDFKVKFENFKFLSARMIEGNNDKNENAINGSPHKFNKINPNNITFPNVFENAPEIKIPSKTMIPLKAGF